MPAMDARSIGPVNKDNLANPLPPPTLPSGGRRQRAGAGRGKQHQAATVAGGSAPALAGVSGAAMDIDAADDVLLALRAAAVAVAYACMRDASPSFLASACTALPRTLGRPCPEKSRVQVGMGP
uniref:Uncharacterized protein n=1 Tax=Oryza sativa subsp. japonica TaxID=39947 RepID=Q6ZA43_ORYSJ|nr:hypothetical protein [Oryza sativa Japonica Group]